MTTDKSYFYSGIAFVVFTILAGICLQAHLNAIGAAFGVLSFMSILIGPLMFRDEP
jgi:hypothetical protein